MSVDPVAEPATILVIDDNVANRDLARSTLEPQGYRVVLATGGAAGVEAFEREAPACVLLDMRMPEMDGVAVCEKIRSLPGGKETPVLFLTALRDVDTFDRALAAGADDFLTKPIQPTALVLRVQAALKMRRMGAELREHYELLRHQRDDLLRLQLQKERLMAFVVHDLKNPVNSIDLHAQVLLRDRELSEKARGSVTQIRSETRSLTRMILNLLDLSKGDEGKLVAARTELELRTVVADVFGELEVMAELRGVHLVSSVEVERVRADEDLLRRLLANLLENAIRHAPVGTAVSLGAASKPDGVDLRVADAGGGIPADMRERIFDPFVQSEASADGHASRTGRGLGLAFCKLVAEAHGGRIWVEDAAAGAVFCVRFPHES